MKTYTPLTDEQWAILLPLLPEPERKCGKPHASWRRVLNSILFVVLLKAKWGTWPNMPDFVSKSAAHRWYLRWKKSGLLDQIIEAVKQLHPQAEIVLPEDRSHFLWNRNADRIRLIAVPAQQSVLVG